MFIFRPLHLAARNGLVRVTRELIERGADVYAVDAHGLTPALACAPDASVAECLRTILAAAQTSQPPIINQGQTT